MNAIRVAMSASAVRRTPTMTMPISSTIRMSSGSSLVRPAPPPLPREQQREFEELVRAAQAPLSSPQRSQEEADMSIHPDARAPLQAEFQGDVNPATGEQGGPKREPVGRWSDEGDWSFKGRVSDF